MSLPINGTKANEGGSKKQRCAYENIMPMQKQNRGQSSRQYKTGAVQMSLTQLPPNQYVRKNFPTSSGHIPQKAGTSFKDVIKALTVEAKPSSTKDAESEMQGQVLSNVVVVDQYISSEVADTNPADKENGAISGQKHKDDQNTAPIVKNNIIAPRGLLRITPKRNLRTQVVKMQMGYNNSQFGNRMDSMMYNGRMGRNGMYGSFVNNSYGNNYYPRSRNYMYPDQEYSAGDRQMRRWSNGINNSYGGGYRQGPY